MASTLYVVYTSTERSGFNLREGDYSNHFVPEDWRSRNDMAGGIQM